MSIELILGGARSGKSRLAEARCLDLQRASTKQELIYIATATAGDSEMAARIAMHQRDRDPRWQVVEAPLELVDVLAKLSPDSVVLVDCLTLWLTNWLCENGLEAYLAERMRLLEVLAQSQAHIVLVSNEVGHGIVPMGELSRQFVDESGRLHQAIAAIASRVQFVMAGLPLTLKDECIQPMTQQGTQP
jgi:adenosylcobinamide kinase/adenosylcobinamide-phosphate guanylyltransferase